MTEEPLERCPKCGKKPERIISGGAALLFKGSGFYITDYRSESYKSAAKQESGTPAKSDSDKSPAAPTKESSKETPSKKSSDSNP